MWRQLLYLLLAFAGGTAIAALLGAANTGVAISVGAIFFTATLVGLILTD